MHKTGCFGAHHLSLWCAPFVALVRTKTSDGAQGESFQTHHLQDLQDCGNEIIAESVLKSITEYGKLSAEQSKEKLCRKSTMPRTSYLFRHFVLR